jgi:AcrR family transcriptional regulator
MDATGSHELARRWADALDGLVAPTLTRTQIEALLAGLCEQLLVALRGDAGIETGLVAASALVAANYRDEETVSRTVSVICREMVEEVCTSSDGHVDAGRVRERAIDVAAEFAAGFTAALRMAALAEQETTLAAALSAAREAQAQRQLSEARFAAIFAGVSVGIGTVDAATGECARQAFAELGPEAPLDDIARRAGVGPGTLYRHFPHREALIAAVYRSSIEDLRRRAHELAETCSALDAWMRAQVEFVMDKRGLAVTLKAALDHDSETFELCSTMANDAAATVLKPAQAAGLIRPDIQPRDLIRLGHGIGVACETAPDAAERLLDVAFAGLRVAR